MEEIYVNVNSLMKSVQPAPEERHPGEPAQPARDVNDSLCSSRLRSGTRSSEGSLSSYVPLCLGLLILALLTGLVVVSVFCESGFCLLSHVFTFKNFISQPFCTKTQRALVCYCNEPAGGIKALR